MKKVAVDITPLSVDHWTGVQYLIYEQLKALVETGNDIHWKIFGIFPRSKSEEIKKKLNFKSKNFDLVIIPVPARFHYFLLSHWQNKMTIPIDLFLGALDGYISTGYFYLPSSASIKAGYIFDLYDYKKNSDINSHTESQRIEKIINNVDHVLTISNYSSKKIKKLFKKDSIVVYPGVNKKFCVNKYGKKKIKNDYLIYVGGMHERKNIVRLLKAIKTIGYYDLLVVTNDLSKLNQYISESGIDRKYLHIKSNLSFDKLRSYYHHSVACIYPSIEEGFGFPIVEAKASETLVITSNTTSTFELAKENAILVNPNSTLSIINAIKKIKNINTSERKKIVKRQKQEILEYSYIDSARKIINLFR